MFYEDIRERFLFVDIKTGISGTLSVLDRLNHFPEVYCSTFPGLKASSSPTISHLVDERYFQLLNSMGFQCLQFNALCNNVCNPNTKTNGQNRSALEGNF